MTRGYNEETRQLEHTINVALWPAEFKHRWICSKGHPMFLYPVSRDLPATHWTCECKSITIENRDRAFEAAIEQIRLKYQLKTLEYNRENDYFTMVSSVFMGRDRIEAKRKQITPSLHDEIVAALIYLLKASLGISIESIEDLLIE